MRRREFISVVGGAVAAWPLVVRAQKTLPRFGWLVFGDAKKMGPVDQSLKDALAQAGLLEGRNVEIVFRYANGMPDRLAELATELAAQGPTLLSGYRLAKRISLELTLIGGGHRKTYRKYLQSDAGRGSLHSSENAQVLAAHRLPAETS
ncbi:hypothetical protein [Bradyrhizobium sp. JYMT SZCCT0180]|uniref:hypothetical protein n=1 Tax=Bradyrhizobium sp. JYMT SZCCT0180 TaxID=2807666 RepID=UPI001BAAE709|nr:hypothetical protein [Bradyrhizobium sp. JYMT SZCCT0180]MBR1216152.1 hypothetical protein [Bradyrhizobium sp. JYMT SZCCT0180]